MVREAWCIRVPKSGGEKQRLVLIREGLLDPTLVIRTEGDELLFPVKEPCEGCGKALFEEVP